MLQPANKSDRMCHLVAMNITLCTPTHLLHGDVDCIGYLHQIDRLLTHLIQITNDMCDLEGGCCM